MFTMHWLNTGVFSRQCRIFRAFSLTTLRHVCISRTFARSSMANKNMWESSSVTGIWGKNWKSMRIRMKYFAYLQQAATGTEETIPHHHYGWFQHSSISIPFDAHNSHVSNVNTYMCDSKWRPPTAWGKNMQKILTRAFPSFVECNANFGHEYWICSVRAGVQPHPIIHESICEHWTNYVMATNVTYMWKSNGIFFACSLVLVYHLNFNKDGNPSPEYSQISITQRCEKNSLIIFYDTDFDLHRRKMAEMIFCPMFMYLVFVGGFSRFFAGFFRNQC